MINLNLSSGCKDNSVSTNQSVDKLKNKNHMIISIDAEKISEKIQHPFMIKLSTVWVMEEHTSTYMPYMASPWLISYSMALKHFL